MKKQGKWLYAWQSENSLIPVVESDIYSSNMLDYS